MRENLFRDYFSFTKKERTGILVLLLLILLVGLVPRLYPVFVKPKIYDHSVFEKEMAMLDSSQRDTARVYANGFDDNYQDHGSSYRSNYPPRNEWKGELFEFDPNTLSPEGWKRLGLRDKTITTIQNYTNKGGRFRQAEDISKIWGLHPDEIERLLPYVKIATNNAGNYPAEKNYQPYEKKEFKKEARIVDINSADSNALVSLPGIGPGFARRIINFRARLGGFVSVDQVAETFGLPDSTFQKIRPMLQFNGNDVQQININTATADELKSHPYIRYALANAIVQYRAQHGNYASVNDIKKIMMVSEDIFKKVSPYIKTN